MNHLPQLARTEGSAVHRWHGRARTPTAGVVRHVGHSISATHPCQRGALNAGTPNGKALARGARYLRGAAAFASTGRPVSELGGQVMAAPGQSELGAPYRHPMPRKNRAYPKGQAEGLTTATARAPASPAAHHPGATASSLLSCEGQPTACLAASPSLIAPSARTCPPRLATS